jgi:hypothetical protein
MARLKSCPDTKPGSHTDSKAQSFLSHLQPDRRALIQNKSRALIQSMIAATPEASRICAKLVLRATWSRGVNLAVLHRQFIVRALPPAILSRDWTVSTEAMRELPRCCWRIPGKSAPHGRREALEIQTPYYPLDCLCHRACMVSHLGELAPQTRSGTPVRRFSLQTIDRCGTSFPDLSCHQPICRIRSTMSALY